MKSRFRFLAFATLLHIGAAAAQSLPFGGMDRSISPGVDFYGYANGGWLSSTPIPADRASYGVGSQLQELNDRRVAALIRSAAATAAAAGDARKVADYYSSFMDEREVESRGLKPLKPTLERIAAITDRAGLARYLGSTLRADVDVLNNTSVHTDNLFGLWVAQDLDQPARYLPFVLQGGLGMPDRDYYLSDLAATVSIRAQYREHIARMLRLAGDADAEAEAAAIFALEAHIAQVHASQVESEDVKRGDNHWSRETFRTRAPGLMWDAYFGAAGLGSQSEFVAWQPGAIRGIAALAASEPLATWKAYLKFHALEHFAAVLPQAFVAEAFAFHGNAVNGTPQISVRWKRAVQSTSGALGEAVGKLYVQRYFTPLAKARIEDLVRHLIVAFGERIDALAWMAPQTKLKAKAKLAALKVEVGYPDQWRDYSQLKIVPGDAFGNAERAEIFEYRRNLAKLGKPVDRAEWVMTPQQVNAVNLPVMNALNFPAALLQSPFFDPNRPAPMNYGAIGAIIGHEISHSFDDSGALFDATGRLANWWTAADFEHFQASAAQLVAQYASYRPFPDLAVNGKQTLDENIADVAGLAVAYSAWQLSQNGAQAPQVLGLSGDQQFFLSFAQTWRTKYRDAALRSRIITDGHAPAQYRAVTVRNLDAWYRAFAVMPGQALYLDPAQRVRMW